MVYMYLCVSSSPLKLIAAATDVNHDALDIMPVVVASFVINVCKSMVILYVNISKVLFDTYKSLIVNIN